MSTVGYATMQVIPSLRGIERQMQSQLGGLVPIANRIGGQSGGGFVRSFGTNLVAGLDGLGATVNRWAKRGFMAAGATAAATMGLALVGGLRRVLDTEDATIAFRQMGLGVSDIDRVLQGVDRTFDGTPFANPDGFNISAQLLASGRGLETIEDDLRNIANVTSQTLNKDLGATSDTFLRVAAQGRLYAQDLNFLARQGIPMRQILADGIGVSVDRLNDMVSAGDITFDTMMDVIGATERFEGAAQAMGSSTRGAFRNVLTGVARLGESFLGPLFGENGTAVQALQSIRGALRDATPWADELGRRFADWLVPALERAGDVITSQIVPAFREARDWFDENRDMLRAVAEAAAPVLAVLIPLASAVNWLSKLTPPRLILTAIAAIATGIVYLWQNSEEFRDRVTAVWETVTRIVSRAVDWIRDAVGRFTALFVANGEPTARLERFRERFQSIWDSIVSIVETIRDLVEPVLADISAFWEAHGDDVIRIVGYFMEAVLTVVDTVLGLIEGLVDVFGGILTGDFERIGDGLTTIWEAIWDGFNNLLDAGFQMAVETFGGWIVRLIYEASLIPGKLVDAVSEWIGRAAGWARDSIASAREAFVDRVASLLVWFRGLPERIVNAVVSLPGRLKSWGRESINEGRVGFTDRLLALLDWFRALPDRIIATLRALPSMMARAGRDAMDGFRQGIEERAVSVVSAAAKVAARALQGVKNGLESRSPSRKFAEVGNDAVLGFVQGLDQPRWVSAAVTDLARQAEQSARSSLAPLASRGTIGSPRDSGLPAGGAFDDELQRRIARAIEDGNKATQTELRELRAEVAGLVDH